MKRKNLLAVVLITAISAGVWAQNRTEYLLEKNWKFIRTDQTDQK
ncbi:MAG: hypothetical protein H6Q19_926, partial [Bacteroidetes bacterium]|nr:hypothetical protein [Bacteroidota bacterium]